MGFHPSLSVSSLNTPPASCALVTERGSVPPSTFQHTKKALGGCVGRASRSATPRRTPIHRASPSGWLSRFFFEPTVSAINVPGDSVRRSGPRYLGTLSRIHRNSRTKSHKSLGKPSKSRNWSSIMRPRQRMQVMIEQHRLARQEKGVARQDHQ